MNAIFSREDVPSQERRHIAANLLFFELLGSPGGAEAVGRQDRDCIPEFADGG